jgi:hypothetical protein
VLALVVGQTAIVPVAPHQAERADAPDVMRGGRSLEVLLAKLEAARPDPRRPSGGRIALAAPPRAHALAHPGQLSTIATAFHAHAQDHAGSRTAVARGPPAA